MHDVPKTRSRKVGAVRPMKSDTSNTAGTWTACAEDLSASKNERKTRMVHGELYKHIGTHARAFFKAQMYKS